jgi:hypothetical protein
MPSTKTDDENIDRSWVSRLSIREMKQLTQCMPESKQCLERSDFENLIVDNFQSVEECRAALEKNTSTSSLPSSSANPDRLTRLKMKVQTVLSQDRGVQNFEHYTPGTDHLSRMKALAQSAPELYDNPDITPRSRWFQHPRYRQNSQMPPFHVHFRQEMQEVLRCLYQAYAAAASADSSSQHYLRRAAATFHGSMRGLHGHVSIEEYACFPLYKNMYPGIDLQFLYADHKNLHRAEETVADALDTLRQQPTAAPGQIVDAMEMFLKFDDQLMAHLGEEEELVVPMSLTKRDVFF